MPVGHGTTANLTTAVNRVATINEGGGGRNLRNQPNSQFSEQPNRPGNLTQQM